MKPAVLANRAEVRGVLQAVDAWEAAGDELGARQAADPSSKVSSGEVAEEVTGLALAGLLHGVLSEHLRMEEDEVIDEPTARAEESGVVAQRPAAEESPHHEPRPEAGVPAGGGGGIASPPRQRSCRVVAAGWLRRRSEPEVSG